VALLSGFADQAAVAIEKGRLLREAEQGRALLERLYRVALTMRRSWARADRLGAFLAGSHDVVGFHRLDVLVTPDGAAFEPIAGRGGAGADREGLAASPAAGYFSEAYRTLQPIALLPAGGPGAFRAVHRDDPAFGAGRYVIAPLVAGERAIGIVVGENRPGDPPVAASSIDPFFLLCQQLAMALEETRLYEEAQAREREATQLYEVTGQLASTLELDRILDVIVRKTGELARCDAVAIFRHDPTRGGLAIVRQEGLAPARAADIVLPAGTGLVGRAFQERRSLWSRDLPADPAIRRDPALEARVRAIGVRGALAAPIVSRGDVHGVLSVNFRVPHDFRDDEVRLVSALATHAAIALDNARLHEAAVRRGEELGALLRATRTVMAGLDLGVVLDRIVEEAALISGEPFVELLLVDRDTGLLQVSGARGAEVPASLRVRRETTYSGRVAATGQLLYVADSQNDPGNELAAWDRETGMVTYLGLPVKIRDEVLGVLTFNTRRPRQYTPDELTYLTSFADQVAIAVDNARLYAATRAREQEATRLYNGLALLGQASRALHRTLDVDSMLRGALAELARVFGAGAALVVIVGEGGEPVRRVGHWLSPEHERAVVVRRGGLTQRVRETRQPVLMGDVREHADRVQPGHLEHGVRALAAFPIIARGHRVLGALYLYYTTPQSFPEGDVHLLTAYAEHLATALENAQLYEEAQTDRTRLGLIFDSTSDGIVLLGRDGRVETANRRAGELLGFDPDRTSQVTLAGLLADRFPSAAEHERAVATFGALLADPDRGGRGDIELQKPARRILHWVGRPTRNAAGATVGLTVTFQDVTEEREVSQMKSDFVSFVTHQLRTPLAGIRWMLELAGRDPALSEETRSFMADALSANLRLVTLVNDLLNIARLESGKLKLAPEEVDLGRMTGEVLEELAGLIRDKGHRLTVAAEAALPPAWADPQLLRQAVVNLVSNAVKYTPPGGEVAIRIGRDGEHVQWAVRDSGIGIPPEAQGRLFEKFYRAENAVTMETEGTGLGLYLVRLIVEQLGGRVACASEEGRGSTFTLALPRRP
jgi:signal transduction histidine kinase/putative methionine-R-sulfoxide reductase with GAF domain